LVSEDPFGGPLFCGCYERDAECGQFPTISGFLLSKIEIYRIISLYGDHLEYRV
jgi:hypothetical protein